ncbi:hypothetical protein ACHAWF_016815 [Thalassiosira exigua]
MRTKRVLALLLLSGSIGGAGGFRRPGGGARSGEGEGDARSRGGGGRGKRRRAPGRRADAAAGAGSAGKERRDSSSLLRSLLGAVAERGSSHWGDHYPSSSSSSSSKGTTEGATGGRQTPERSPEQTPERLVRQIVAYALGGGAAATWDGSAFAAAAAGAFLGTAAAALGSVLAAWFEGDDGGPGGVDPSAERGRAEEGLEPGGDERGEKLGPEKELESCDFDPVDEADVNVGGTRETFAPTASNEESSSRRRLDAHTLSELKRCYDGGPEGLALDFFEQRRSDNVCIVDGSDSSGDGVEGTHPQHVSLDDVGRHEPEGSELPSAAGLLAGAIEDACAATDGCDGLAASVAAGVDDAAPKQRVEVVWHDAFDGASYARYFTGAPSPPTVQHRKRERTLRRERRGSTRPRPSHRATRTASDDGEGEESAEHWTVLTDAERDGALLLSETFRVASSALGLTADAVRFAGETVAATAGGAARVTGGAVRVAGWAVGSLGEALENVGQGDGGGSGGERGAGGAAGGMGNGESRSTTTPDEVAGKERKKRRVAGRSVRLIGDAVEEIADSVLLAGSAAERVAFAAAGAAEGAVRAVEDLASGVSAAFSREGRRGVGGGGGAVEPFPASFDDDDAGESESSTKDDLEADADESSPRNAEEHRDAAEEGEGTRGGALADLFDRIASEAVRNAGVVTVETAGVQSLAPEMLGVFLLCFVASVLLLSSKKGKGGVPRSQMEQLETKRGDAPGVEQRPEDVVLHGVKHETSNHDNDSHSTLTAESTMKIGPNCIRDQPLKASLAKRVAVSFLSLVLIPLKLARLLMLFGKESALLVIFMCGWFFLSQVSQYKVLVIQRKSELLGYRLAIESVGKSSASAVEPAIWLNGILNTLWRVQSGGLEPLLSSSVGAILAESLRRPYAKPSVVAHVALEAFTFGSSPPVVSGIRLKGFDDDRSTVYLEVDVGMLLDDAALLLEVVVRSM